MTKARVVMLFVDARAPKCLRRWYAGGSLVGIGKDDLPLDQDARPIVVGETFRRILTETIKMFAASLFAGRCPGIN